MMFVVLIPSDAAQPLFVVDFKSDQAPSGVDINTRYAWDRGEYLVLYAPGSSLILNFNIPEGKPSILGLKLSLVDRSTYNAIHDVVPGQGGPYSPVRITANGNIAADAVDVRWLEDHTFTYQIGQFLKPGRNKVSVEVIKGARTQYEIRRVSLNY